MQNNPAAAVIVAAIGLIVCAIAAISLALRGHGATASVLGGVCVGYAVLFAVEWKEYKQQQQRRSR